MATAPCTPADVALHWMETGLIATPQEVHRPVSETHITDEATRYCVALQTPTNCRVVAKPDFEPLPIDTDYSLPPIMRTGRNNRTRNYDAITRYPFMRMQVGDSFFVPRPAHRTLRSVGASIGGKIKNVRDKTGMYFTWRTDEPNDGIRVWRVPEWYHWAQTSEEEGE